MHAYDLWESGHISGFSFNPLEGIKDCCALTCLANPSGDTSGTQYKVTVVLKDNGVPLGASCSCVAGLGEACTHIAGLLFGIEDFVARGYRELPDGQGLTDKLCRWIIPRGPKVEPKPLKEVKVKKNIPGKQKKEKQFSVKDYQPLPQHVQEVDYDSLTLLHHTLCVECPELPWVKAVAPAIVHKFKPNTKVISIPKAPLILPAAAGFMDPVILPAREITIKTTNEPPTPQEKMKNQSTVTSVKYSNEEKATIEKLKIQISPQPYYCIKLSPREKPLELFKEERTNSSHTRSSGHSYTWLNFQR